MPTTDSLYNTTLKPQVGGAPVLNAEATYVGFDVHGKYPWALNATANLRSFVPKAILTEYKVTSSAAARALKLYLAQSSESSVGRAALGGQVGAAIGATIGGPILGSLIGGSVGALAGGFGPNYGDMTGFTNESPYFGLYEGTPTGFVYELPYLNVGNNMTAAKGTWEPYTEDKALGIVKTGGQALGTVLGGGLGSILGGAAGGAVADAFKNSTAIGNAALTLNNPGVSRETVKGYTPNDEGENVSLSFYLYNTENFDDIKNNWNFLFTLTYQNLPNRRSLNLMDPPCMYTVEIPNYKYFPAAVISSVNVSNMGTTRLVDLDTGEIVSTQLGNNGNVKVIPEVYKVDITIQSLLQVSRNLAYYINDSSAINKITVIEKAKS